MKVALVSPYDWTVPGGVNSHVEMLAHQLHDRGHQAQIIAPASGAVDDPLVTVIGYPIRVPASGSVVRIPVNPRLGWRVREVLARERFDVVHVHEPLMPLLPLEVLKHSRRANPQVVNAGTFHANREAGSRLYALSRWYLKRRFRELDGKVAVSPPAARYVSRYFPGLYNIIPNGIDIAHWERPELAPAPELAGTVNILYVGRAERRKGLSVLLSAFAQVHARRPETRLVVVGPDSPARRRTEAAVSRSGQPGVIFVPAQAYEELPRYHRSAQIFCSPALGNESQGYVLLEAMAAGLPVVASNIDGYASVITDDVSGALVAPGDSSALAATLCALIDDPARRDRLAAEGRRHVDHYGWPRVTDRIVSYYERLLAERDSVDAARGRARHRLRAKPAARAS